MCSSDLDLAVVYMHTSRAGTNTLPTVGRNAFDNGLGLPLGYGRTMNPAPPSYDDCPNTNVGQQDGAPHYSPGPVNDAK